MDSVLPLTDDEHIFSQWITFQQEPTLSCPADVTAEQNKVARLRTIVQNLRNASPGTERDNELAIALKFHELSCWRLFPFNLLPDDIILQIFRQGTFCSPDNRRGPIMPILYSSICKRWRHLALDASWLWGFIGFGDQEPYTLTRVFIERSRSSPLIIEIDLSDRKFDYEDDEYWIDAEPMVKRLALLTPHIHRWKSFYCCTDNWDPMFGALNALGNLSAPILKRIELRQSFDNFVTSEIPPQLMLLANGAPALEGLVLDKVPIDWHHFPFSNLIELELLRLTSEVSPTLRDFSTILHRSPNLRKLSLIATKPRCWDGEIIPSHGFPIELLHLEELRIGGTETLEDAIWILNMILPGAALRSLFIGGFPKDSDFDLFLPLLHSNFSHVERLILSSIAMDAAAAARWLDALPKVSHISLYGDRMQTTILDALSTPAQHFGIDAPRGVLCPKLVALAPFVADLAIHDFVMKRQAMNAPPITTLVWDVNDKEEAIEILGPLQKIIEFEYEGELVDSEDEWVGPDPSEWPMDTDA
ncbi:hypothetical protein K439DRAFT_1621313 [Ramaria rubella]|nr:hypothetical protein K439DRAFT_1621313 [Ramaria rubella]